MTTDQMPDPVNLIAAAVEAAEAVGRAIETEELSDEVLVDDMATARRNLMACTNGYRAMLQERARRQAADALWDACNYGWAALHGKPGFDPDIAKTKMANALKSATYTGGA